jgi:hypothetical protein
MVVVVAVLERHVVVTQCIHPLRLNVCRRNVIDLYKDFSAHRTVNTVHLDYTKKEHVGAAASIRETSLHLLKSARNTQTQCEYHVEFVNVEAGGK